MNGAHKGTYKFARTHAREYVPNHVLTILYPHPSLLLSVCPPPFFSGRIQGGSIYTSGTTLCTNTTFDSNEDQNVRKASTGCMIEKEG